MKNARLQKAKTRKIRKLSAFNVFQRESMKNHSLDKEQYRAFIKDLGKQWREMSKERKNDYQLQADHQQQLLDDLESKPLPTETANFDDESDIWHNAKKKRSIRRLDANRQNFREHNVWNLRTQYGDSLLTAH